MVSPLKPCCPAKLTAAFKIASRVSCPLLLLADAALALALLARLLFEAGWVLTDIQIEQVIYRTVVLILAKKSILQAGVYPSIRICQCLYFAGSEFFSL